MIDSAAVAIAIEFLVLIVVVAGVIFRFDRKQSERLDGFHEDMRETLRYMQALASKVGRLQGDLDVLVFGERGVLPPAASERVETEIWSGEPAGERLSPQSSIHN